MGWAAFTTASMRVSPALGLVQCIRANLYDFLDATCTAIAAVRVACGRAAAQLRLCSTALAASPGHDGCAWAVAAALMYRSSEQGSTLFERLVAALEQHADGRVIYLTGEP